MDKETILRRKQEREIAALEPAIGFLKYKPVEGTITELRVRKDIFSPFRGYFFVPDKYRDLLALNTQIELVV